MITPGITARGEGERGPPFQKVKVLLNTNLTTWTVPDDCDHIDEIHMVGGGQAGFDGTENNIPSGGSPYINTTGAGGSGAWYAASFLTKSQQDDLPAGTVTVVKIGKGGTANGAFGEASYIALQGDPGNPIVQAPGGGTAGPGSTPTGQVHFRGGNTEISKDVFTEIVSRVPIGIAGWPYITDSTSLFFLPAMFPPYTNPNPLVSSPVKDWWVFRQGYFAFPNIQISIPPLPPTANCPAGMGGGGCAGVVVGGTSGIQYSTGDKGGGDPGDLSVANIILAPPTTIPTNNSGLGGGAGDIGNALVGHDLGGIGGSLETLNRGIVHSSGPRQGALVLPSEGGDGGTFTGDKNQTFPVNTPLGYGGSYFYGPNGHGNGGGGASFSPIFAKTVNDVTPLPGGNGGNGFRWTDTDTNDIAGPGGGGAGGNGATIFDVNEYKRWFDNTVVYGVGSNGGAGGIGGGGGGGGGSWSTGAPAQYRGHGGAGGDGFIAIVYTKKKQKTKLILPGSTTFTVPHDFHSLVEIHAISGGTSGGPSYGGCYNNASGNKTINLNSFSIHADDVLDCQIGAGINGAYSNPSLLANETWIKDNDDTMMVLAPTTPLMREGLLDPSFGGIWTPNLPVPFIVGTLPTLGGKGSFSAGAAAGPRPFGPIQGDPTNSGGTPDQTPHPYGDEGAGSGGNDAIGGGGGAIVDPDGTGFPGYPGDGLCDANFPVGGPGALNSKGESDNGAGGRGGNYNDNESPDIDGQPGTDGKTWQDSDTHAWAGPGGGGGGGGRQGGVLSSGGAGGNYGGGGGNGDGAGSGAAAPGVIAFVYNTV